MKKTILISIILYVISCSNNNTSETVNQTTTLIAKGWLSYNDIFTQQNLVITNDTEWQQLIADMQTVNPDILESFEETDVDFETFQILAAFDIKNSTTTVDITNVTENTSNIVVTVENLQHGITQDVAHPFHIVKIRRSNKPVVFE